MDKQSEKKRAKLVKLKNKLFCGKHSLIGFESINSMTGKCSVF